MKTEKILISLPHDLAVQMRSYIPARQRSKFIARIIKEEIDKKEQALYDAACMAEKDDMLNKEMQEFAHLASEGIADETW